MKTPEIIYTRKVPTNRYYALAYLEKTERHDDIEYIHADIAEQVAKEFLMWYCPLPEKRIGELFTKFINSRSKL
jgi:hypothetical protein